ncbi:DUF1569 domain-containing protein [Singulisphaera sp. PoT]|uniref:DUF1569 domain-containing protein n=1 Tax=Singulisphaera sp. PoT TaxID=3411797 RepID=UPI003BF51059
MGETPSRRELDFREFDAVLHDVDSLAAGGYDRVGNWDLAQTCKHLADWMRYPLDGFPPAPLPIRLMLALVRNTVAPRMFRKVLEQRTMPGGSPTLPASVPPPGIDESAAIAELRQAIARFRNHEGPFHPSPLLGELDAETSKQAQLIHCAHHLSFLLPRARRAVS